MNASQWTGHCTETCEYVGREYPHLESCCLASAMVEAADRFSFVEAVISPRCAPRKKGPARDLRPTAFLYRFVPTGSNTSRERPPYHGAWVLTATRSPEPRPTCWCPRLTANRCVAVAAPAGQPWRLDRSAGRWRIAFGTNAIVASWCGMRSIVALVTALALPATFPRRD